VVRSMVRVMIDSSGSESRAIFARLIEPFCHAMPKLARFDELPLPAPTPKRGGTRFRWLYDALRSAIVTGTLGAGAQLPSTRSLARQHGIGRGTVVAVFEQLVSEGYVESIVGSGTFVRQELNGDARKPVGSTQPSPPEGSGAELASGTHLIVRHAFPQLSTNHKAPVFRLGQPPLDVFPVKIWSRIATRRLRRLDRSLLSHRDWLGWRPLRAEIAAHLGSTRGIRCSADEIVVTSGTQHSLNLIARVVLDPRDRVWMEDPGYPAATALFRALGAEVIGVPVDDSGIDCRAAPRHLRPAKLAYVTPGCQFPLGVPLSLPRRRQLLEWARKAHAWIVEDDYDGEFRFSGRPLAALRSLGAGDCVIYVNSFNKSLFPTLRLGFLLAPARLIDAVAACRSVLDPVPGAIEQAILCDFISAGHMARHLRRMRDICAERIDLLRSRVRLELEGVMQLLPTHVGLHAVGWLAAGSDDQEAARRAAAHDVDSLALSRFTVSRTMNPALVLGIASGDAQAIRRGVTRLATALREVDAARKARVG
jgi:GntR family transcriptional regulator/MocR family aminotransferase